MITWLVSVDIYHYLNSVCMYLWLSDYRVCRIYHYLSSVCRQVVGFPSVLPMFTSPRPRFMSILYMYWNGRWNMELLNSATSNNRSLSPMSATENKLCLLPVKIEVHTYLPWYTMMTTLQLSIDGSLRFIGKNAYQIRSLMSFGNLYDFFVTCQKQHLSATLTLGE